MKRSRRATLATITAVAAATALALTGCTAGSSGSGFDKTAPTKLEGTVSFWHFFSDREAKVIQSVVDDFEKANPGVKVEVHSGQDDEKLRKAIATGPRSTSACRTRPTSSATSARPARSAT